MNSTIDQNYRSQELASAAEVGEMLKCSPRTVLRLADAGRLPPGFKIGALRRWRVCEINEWIEEQSRLKGKKR